jgi:hypothetical protein
MMPIDEADLRNLQDIYKANANTKLAFKYFSSCTPEENTVTAEELDKFFKENGVSDARPQIVRLFQDLQNRHFGEYKIGRRTQKTRFISSRLNLRKLGKIVLQGSQASITMAEKMGQSSTIGNTPQNNTESDQKAFFTSVESGIDMVPYPFPLRPNLTITLNLPKNLTDSEADRLAGYIKALPIR